MKGKIKILYLGSYSLDAVEYYVNLLAEGVSKKFGKEVESISDISNIDSDDIVIVLDAKSHFLVSRKHKKCKVISWFQGVLPEENKMTNPKFNFVNFLRIKWWEFLEKFSLNHSFCNVFVSEEMRQHYIKKYKYKPKTNDIIIPCYNKSLNKECFIQERYKKANFVYAGSLDSWQCFEETLQLFKDYQAIDASATLSVLTKEIDKAKELLKKYDLENVEVVYVPYKEVDKKLQEFKYAFLLRQKHIVNNVATPTKMNTYMANGLIPIFTDSVGFYSRVIPKSDGILVSDQFDKNRMENVKAIQSYQQKITDAFQLKQQYEAFFDLHYNKDKYIGDIINKI
jgi:hypothetical protein